MDSGFQSEDSGFQDLGFRTPHSVWMWYLQKIPNTLSGDFDWMGVTQFTINHVYKTDASRVDIQS